MLALITRPYQGCETLEKQIETPSGKWKPRGSSYVLKNNMAKQTPCNIRKSMSQRFQRQCVFSNFLFKNGDFGASAPNFNLIPLEYVLPSWFLKMKASGSGYVYSENNTTRNNFRNSTSQRFQNCSYVEEWKRWFWDLLFPCGFRNLKTSYCKNFFVWKHARSPWPLQTSSNLLPQISTRRLWPFLARDLTTPDPAQRFPPEDVVQKDVPNGFYSWINVHHVTLKPFKHWRPGKSQKSGSKLFQK